MTDNVRDVFVKDLPSYNLMGMDITVKPASSFSFQDMTELGVIQDEAADLLKQATDEGALDENGDIDTTVAKYALAGLELNLKRIGIHIQHVLDLDELKQVPADEIRDLEDFLSSKDEEKEDLRAQKNDKRQQKRLMRQKSGRT